VSIFENARFSHNKTVAEAAICVWTSNDIFYKACNRVLVQEDEPLERWILMIRVLCNYLTRPSHTLSENLQTWRGSKLTRTQTSLLKPGVVIRPPMFVSTSLSPAIAASLAHGPIVRFNIPAGCRNACLVSNHSAYAEEEVLLPPYTPIRVTYASADEIRVDVLDGKDYQQHELLTGRHARAWPI
jgi:hypothetical protein